MEFRLTLLITLLLASLAVLLRRRTLFGDFFFGMGVSQFRASE